MGLILAPLFLVAKFGCYAIFIRGASAAFGLQGDFRKTFTVIVWSSTAVVLEGLCISLVLWIRGIDAVQTLDDLEVPLGLNLLLPSSNPAVFDLMGSLNPFELWFIFLLAAGIAHVYSISVWRGFLISAPVWLSGVVVQFTVRLLAF
jgi:hypothetical protein